MAKTKISEFSATPGNNTDIDGINIAEGCAPSGINDAIRELMSQLKDFQTGAAGDSFNGPIGSTTPAAGAFTTLSASSTVSGAGFSTYLASPPAIGGTAPAAGSFTTLTSNGTTTLGDAIGDVITINGTATFSNANPTFTAGTANGVGYLNGSKQFTTGSALTFDGTNFATTGIANIGSGARIQGAGSITGTGVGLEMFVAAGVGYYTSYDRTGGAYSPIQYIAGTYQAWNIGGEMMRLTSTGLGIGTSSPSAKLDVSVGSGTTYAIRATSTDNSTNARFTARPYNGTTGIYDFRKQSDDTLLSYLWVTNGATPNLDIMNVQAYAITFGTNNTERARIDSSGNLLVGITSSRSTSADLQVNAPISLKGYTVAGLPTGTVGDIAYVTDALAPSFLATIVGGGAIKTPVFYNGTNWVAY